MARFSLRMFVVFLVLLYLIGTAEAQRPFRGYVPISVLLCLYKDSPPPTKTPDFLKQLSIQAGTGGHADFWKDISHGTINLKGSRIAGWYKMNKTIAESKAYGGGGNPNRGKKFTDCVDEATKQGYKPPANHLVAVITSPGIDIFGFPGGAFLPDTTNAGLMSHEIGHGLSLKHSFSDDPKHRSAPWARIGEYDDQWDIMSYASVFGRNSGIFGLGGPGLNAYHMDRMGWLARNKILRFGADGQSVRTLTLTALNRPSGSGYHLIRIPYDVTDPFKYFTVEYRLKQGWDSGIPSDILLIHQVKPVSGNDYVSYLVRNHDGKRDPKHFIDMLGVKIQLVSKDPTKGSAIVRITSKVAAERCVQGFVWRGARPTDLICVTPERRTQVAQENALGPSRRQPGGGPNGPDTCRQGFVWREAYPGDHVCVPSSSRALAKTENSIAFKRRLGGAAYGPNTCKKGYDWREIDQRDWVCVTPQRRAAIKEENAKGPSRCQPNGSGHCLTGFVWRDAFPGDHVCVPPQSRSIAIQETAMRYKLLQQPLA